MAPVLLAGAVIHVVGGVLATGQRDMPWNRRLDNLRPHGAATGACWPVNLRGWLRWNHLCTGAALATAAAFAIAAHLG